jgi:hypothetical protein
MNEPPFLCQPGVKVLDFCVHKVLTQLANLYNNKTVLKNGQNAIRKLFDLSIIVATEKEAKRL